MLVGLCMAHEDRVSCFSGRKKELVTDLSVYLTITMAYMYLV